MKLQYFDHLEDFHLPELDAKAPAKARKELLKTLARFKLAVPAAKLTDAELAALPAHVLVAWRQDRDLTLSMFAIRDDKLDEELRDALWATTDSTFSSFEIGLGDDRARALQRIERWVQALARHRIACFEDGEEPRIKDGGFDKRFVAAYALRRAQ